MKEISGRLLVLQSVNKNSIDQQLMEKVQNLVLDVCDVILQQIQEGTLEVNQDQYQFQIDKYTKIKSKSVPHLNFPVPEHTHQDYLKVKQMIHKQMQYEKNLQNNARQLQEKVRDDEKWQKQKTQQERKRKFEEKKLKVIEGIQEIKLRKQMRKKQNIQENQSLKQVKTQRKLHQILAEKWKHVEQNEQQEKEKIKEKLKQQKRISFQDIKEHAIKYDETMTKFRESRIAQSRIEQPEIKKYYQSIFLSRIVEEDEKFKQNFQSKKILAKQLYDKKSQYAAIVRQNYKPNTKQTKSVISESQIRASKSLSHLQMFQKGNDYMKQAHSKVSGHKSIIQSKLQRQMDKKQFFKYKNYLTQIRIKKDENQKNKQMSERAQRQNTYEKQIKKIMNEPGLTDQQKFFKAKLVTKKMESQVQKKNPFKLIDSINAKIQILKHVSN